MNEFASEYKRNEAGLILFPPDSDYRKELFPHLDLSAHPAKANIYMVQAIVEYVSEVGQTVMDIMSGTGTIMTAALIGRNVVCIEIEQTYVDILEQDVKALESIAPGIAEKITIIPGDCAKLLPLPITDHIIFSPPYANIMKTKGKVSKFVEETGQRNGLLAYSSSPDNVGNLNEFLYHQKMEIIYKAALDSLPSGGTLTIIIKDHMREGERMFLGKRAQRDCIKAGFQPFMWFQWLPPGSAFTGIHRSRGEAVVDEEDLIILRKP